MKKLILSFALCLATIASTVAQSGSMHGHKKHNFTPEQKATLMLKKMTLHLDLSSSQQKKLKPLLIERASRKAEMMKNHKKNKEARKQMSSDEAFNHMNKRLDEKIAFQNKIKNILNEKQFEKWQKAHARKEKKMKHKRKRKHRKCKKELKEAS